MDDDDNDDVLGLLRRWWRAGAFQSGIGNGCFSFGNARMS